MDEEFGLRGDILLPPGNDHWVVGNELVIAINFIGLDFEKKDKITLTFVDDFKIKNYFLQLDDQTTFSYLLQWDMKQIWSKRWFENFKGYLLAN